MEIELHLHNGFLVAVYSQQDADSVSGSYRISRKMLSLVPSLPPVELELRSMDSLFLLAGITWCALDKLHVLSFATKFYIIENREILHFLFYCFLTLKFFYFIASNEPFIFYKQLVKIFFILHVHSM